MAHCPVEILLPTYNGGRHITALLESLCNQTFGDFTLLTRDDGSADDTLDRTDAFSSRLHIVRLENTGGINLGVIKSFELLISHSTAELLFFCDQDDLWNSSKCERMVDRYLDNKVRYGTMPMLFFSDCEVIDGSDAPVGDSFLAINNVNTACISDPYYLTMKNPAPGCTMAANRSLARASVPFPDATFMHDWWMILDASLCGRIVFLNERLVRYRIHTTNTLGITPDRQRRFFALFSYWCNPDRLADSIGQHKKHIRQGKAVFRKNGRRFSVFYYLLKVISGRLVMPRVVRWTGRGTRYSWVAPPRHGNKNRA